MPRALWNGTLIAESTSVEVVDGNVYFPREALVEAHFEESPTTTVCGWKGTANYLHVVVDGQRNEDAAWTYLDPKEAASQIADHVAFWKGVTVERD